MQISTIFMQYLPKVIKIDFSEKCKKLSEIIIASYDWDNSSSFDERLERNLQNADAEVRKFYNENFKHI